MKFKCVPGMATMGIVTIKVQEQIAYCWIKLSLTKQ